MKQQFPQNPGTLYGGTWAAWEAVASPVGVNTADSDFNTVEKKTGGKKTERHEFKVGYKGYFGSTVGGDDNMIQAYKYSTSSYGTYAYEGSTQAGVNAGDSGIDKHSRCSTGFHQQAIQARQALYSHTLRVTYGKEQHKEERTWHWKKNLSMEKV